MDLFWQSHNPCQQSGSRQYMSAVFYHNEKQKTVAEESQGRAAAKVKARIVTPILPATEFYLAEDYHQKYYLRSNKAMLKEMQARYPAEKDFMASTAVARINGYLGGFGVAANLEKEIDQLGLSPEGCRTLREIVKRRQ